MSGKIFISYRRDDSAGHAGRVHDRLEREFGRDLIFMDVDVIPLGADFVSELKQAVAKCDVLLAIIGPNWLTVRDEDGERRLDNPADFVRIEIAAALRRGIPVVPILLESTRIPRADELPDDLNALSSRNGLNVRHASFHSDMERLIRSLQAPAKSAASGKYLQGVSEALRGNHARAITDFDDAIRLDPKLAIAYCERGKSYARRRDHARAITDLDEAIRLDPKLINAYLERGNCYSHRPDHARAIADYDETIRLDPKLANAYLWRGNCHAHRGDEMRAAADYDEAIRIDPKLANAYFERGKSYTRRGDEARSIADFDEAIRLDPKLANAYFERGKSYARKRDEARAIADYQAAIGLDPTNNAVKTELNRLKMV
jgi:tetratricopeptide (TPR) repeat protein